jgi:thiopurine S-methyltransferase
VPTRREQHRFIVYEHGSLAIWVGDFFAVSDADLEPFDAVYDDAALIALPAELRRSYAAHLQRLIAPRAALLLITLHFDAAGGPPFSVSTEEVSELYAKATEIRQLASVDARAEIPEVVARGASFVREQVYAVTFGQP